MRRSLLTTWCIQKRAPLYGVWFYLFDQETQCFCQQFADNNLFWYQFQRINSVHGICFQKHLKHPRSYKHERQSQLCLCWSFCNWTGGFLWGLHVEWKRVVPKRWASLGLSRELFQICSPVITQQGWGASQDKLSRLYWCPPGSGPSVFRY